MTIETLNQRIANAQSKLEKANKKYARILKAAESNYEQNNPYYYNEYDKRYCEREIEGLTDNIKNYTRMLNSELEKQNSRNVQVIIDFLNAWKNRVYNVYEVDLKQYYEEKDALKVAFNNYDKNRYASNNEDLKQIYDTMRKALYSKLNGYKETREFINRWGKKDSTEVKVRNGEWEHLKFYVERSNNLDEALKLLDKELEREKNKKYDFIIERTNAIVGEITDAAALHIGGNGELNGIIIGTKGKAKVESVGCAGYNIQIFHFRVYIKEVK